MVNAFHGIELDFFKPPKGTPPRVNLSTNQVSICSLNQLTPLTETKIAFTIFKNHA